MDLLAVYALRMSAAMAVTLVNVLIKNGVKIVLVPSKKGYQIEIGRASCRERVWYLV